MNLFHHQQAAYDQLVSLAKTYFDGHWQRLAYRTRWHSMLLGPSGVGKTALAKLIAQATDSSLIQINVPSWMPSGAHDRATAQTLPLLLRHIDGHSRTVLLLDEIEKAHSGGSHSGSQWMGFVRSELYEMLDGRWPTGMKFARDDEEEEVAPRPLEHLSGEKLRNDTFVLAAGTFQSFYDAKPSRAIGFHETDQDCQAHSTPTFDDIVEMMPRELSNRFGHFVTLPELTPKDYHLLAKRAEAELPDWIVPAFQYAISKRLPQAISSKAGCRFVELALAEALQTWKEHCPEKSRKSPPALPKA